MKKGYYINNKGKRYELEPDEVLVLRELDIVELVIPDGVEDVYCERNHLTELILPKSIKGIHCYGNQIKNLVIPDTVRRVGCEMTALDITKYKKHKAIIFLTV